MKIQTKTSFDAAHRLTFHKGKCGNLHGHRWSAEVTIEAVIPMEKSILVDFGDIKNIFEEFDHKTLLFSGDKKLGDSLLQCGIQVIITQFETTAENLAEYFASRITLLVNEYMEREQYAHSTDIRVTVRLYETPNNFAEVVHEGYYEYLGK